jgi:hypothetical protein
VTLIYRLGGRVEIASVADGSPVVEGFIRTSPADLASRPRFLEIIGMRSPSALRPNPGPLVLCRQLALYAANKGFSVPGLEGDAFHPLRMEINDPLLEAVWASGL